MLAKGDALEDRLPKAEVEKALADVCFLWPASVEAFEADFVVLAASSDF